MESPNYGRFEPPPRTLRASAPPFSCVTCHCTVEKLSLYRGELERRALASSFFFRGDDRPRVNRGIVAEPICWTRPPRFCHFFRSGFRREARWPFALFRGARKCSRWECSRGWSFIVHLVLVELRTLVQEFLEFSSGRKLRATVVKSAVEATGSCDLFSCLKHSRGGR